MKLLLDTTFLLPAVGITVEENFKGVVKKLRAKGHQLVISEITVFELSAKASKYVARGELLPERVIRGLRAIMSDVNLEVIPICNAEILSIAMNVRKTLPDFVDCIILASALAFCDVFVTEDQIIHAQQQNSEFRGLLVTRNPKFEIKKITEM